MFLPKLSPRALGRLIRLVGALVIAAIAVVQLSPVFNAGAAPILTITPLTWNVVGLDSNNVTVGPNNFPVGARVCNTGTTAATNVVSTFVWDSSNAYINLRPGSLSTYTISSLAAGACTDFYYEVQITRTAAAYGTFRRYHITATADTLSTISTPTPREIYVEHLVSQSRNSVSDVKLDGVSIAAGGTMTLMVGSTYTIQLVGSTATNGYEQIESFINFPNTIFQVNSVVTTYTANAGTDPLAASKPYGDGCGWVNNPTSPNYRTCTGTGKYGGNITVTYNVTIIGGAGSSQTLNTLIYDFSGSSYHYNGDFSSSSRIASIVSLGISKAFSPASVVAGSTSTLTFTINNPTSSALTGIHFTDTLPTSPAGMTVASPTGASTSGCGSGSFAPAAGATTLTFGSPTTGTIAAGGTCTISVSVTVPASPTSGTYANTSDHLFISTYDTGNFATASLGLTSSTPGTGICGQTLAQWAMPTSAGTTVPPAFSFKASDVTSATAAAGSGITSTIDTSVGNPVNSWAAIGFSTAASLTTSNNDYFQFAVTTTNYTSIGFKFDARLDANLHGPQSLALYSSTDGTTFTSYGSVINPTAAFVTYNPAFTGTANTSGLTYFRIYGYSAGNNGADADLYLDNVTVTGCATALKPTLTKAFSPNPVAVGGTSTLTFTLTNPNATALTGVKFSDTLPSGLQVAATPSASTTCGGSPSWAPSSGATTLDFGQTTGATIPASGSCTVSVNITATTSGAHNNVSGFISSTESGTNSTSTGFAAATLTALLPPVIAKYFDPNPILASAISTLTFLISNPNSGNSLTGVGFTDSYPSLLVNSATPNASTTCSGGTVTAGSGGSSVSLNNNATIAAGASCAVTVNVTSATAGSYLNSVTVTSTNGGTGNTDSDTLIVNTPNPAIDLLKQIGTSASGPWTSFLSLDPTVTTSVYYRFTIENVGDVALSPVSVTDATVSTAGCSWPAMLPVASPTQDPTATCTVGPVTTAAGDHPNTATAHGTYGGTSYDSNTSSADYLGATPGFSLIKQVATSAGGPWSSAISGVTPGSNIYYKFTVVNTGGVPLTSVNVTDPDVSAAGCTFSDPLAIGDATACVVGPITGSLVNGTYTNTATAHGTNSGTVYDTSPSSASYTVSALPADLSVTKSNNTSGSGVEGTPFTWTLTVSNSGSGDATFASGQTIVSDPLPSNATYGSPTAGSFSGITNSGNISCAIGSGTLSCSASGAAVTIGAGGSFAVSFSVTPTAAGTLANTATVDPLGNVTESNEGNNTGSDSVTVASSVPSLSVTKTETSTGPYSVGNTITYDIVVTNTGSTTLTGVTVTDPGTGATLGTCTPAIPASLGLGASLTCGASHVVTQADVDAGSYTNTASGTSNQAGPETDDATVTFTQSPALTVAKTETSTGPYVVGATITYDIVVTNTGNITLTGVTVTDPGTGVTLGTCTPVIPASLAPGNNVTCGASHVVTQADVDAGSYTNTASGTSDQAGPATDDATVTFTQSPTLTVAKSSTTPSVTSAGQVVPYSYLVTNTGNVTLTGISPSDNNIDGSSMSCPGTTLAPAASMTCTAQHTVSQAEIDAGGNLSNTVTASSNEAPDATDDLDIPISQSPALSIAKSVTETSYSTVGTVLHYSYLVTNSGNVTLAGPFTISDNKSSDESCPATASLAPAASITCTATYTVTQPDLDGGSVTNVASASNGSVTSPIDTETVNATQSPALSIVKSVTETSYSTVGTVLHYSYLVTNSGNVTLSGPFTVSDNKSTDESCPATATLAPAASITCTATYTVTQADLDAGSVTNVASASNGSVTSPTDSATVNGSQTSALSILKSVTETSYATVGTVLHYSYQVTNSGNVTLSGPFTVSDNKSSDESCPATASLAPGASITCTATYTVTQADLDAGSVTNVASASNGSVTSPTDSETVSATQNPALSIAKSVTESSYSTVGTVLHYSYLVTNSGNVTLSGPFTVSDNKSSDESCPATASLAPGANITCTATYTVTQADLDAGSVTNIASASNGAVTSSTDTETVPATQNPALTIAKSVTETSYAAVGNVLHYSYLVTNSGNVTLSGPFTVSDNKSSDESCPATASLAPGANITCTATYTVTQADLDAGSVTNIASASNGSVTSPTDTETVNSASTPALAMVKSVTETSYAAVGDVLHYSYLVTNSGNVTLSGPFTISDNKSSDESCPAAASLAPGASITCTATYAVTQADLNAGSVTNIASASNGSVTSPTDSETVNATQSPAIDVTKALTNVSFVNPTTITFTYLITVANTGNVALTGIQVVDDLTDAFPVPATFDVQSVISSANLTVNAGTPPSDPGYDGDTDTDLLDGTDAMNPGESGTITLVVQVQTGGDATTYTNTAIGSGLSPASTTVTDDGSASGPDFTDPALTKTSDVSQAAVGDQVIFTITVTNNGTLPAPNVVVTDPLPSNLTYQNATASPRGAVTYNSLSHTVQIDLSAQDLGVDEVITITIVTEVNSLGQPPTQNTASLTTSDPSDLPQNDASVAALTITGQPVEPAPIALPVTGFAPGVLTPLPKQGPDSAYTSLDGIVLEIPRLGVKTTIVGVSAAKGAWDVTWLGNQAGWLQGTAFPSWAGNSVLTGHVYLADGKPGPFVNVNQLRWGDKVIIHAFGYRYTYEVRQNLKVQPSDVSVLKHQDLPWLTLLTCQGYNEADNSYANRIAVQAVLVKAEEETPSMRGGR